MKMTHLGTTALCAVGFTQILASPPDSMNGIGNYTGDPRTHGPADNLHGIGAGQAPSGEKLLRAPAGEFGSAAVTRNPVRAAAGEFGSGIIKEASTYVVPLAADLEIAGAADLSGMTAAATAMDLGRTEAATS